MKIEFQTIREKAVPEAWVVQYRTEAGVLIEREFQTVSMRGAQEESWRSYVAVKNLGEFVSARRA